LKGYYLVKIIHGKGLHSPGEAKLKELVLNYLNGEGKRVHSSYRSAPPDKGGEGAVLIFL
jgi:DNA-nicking Smr family endonuclease